MFKLFYCSYHLSPDWGEDDDCLHGHLPFCFPFIVRRCIRWPFLLHVFHAIHVLIHSVHWLHYFLLDLPQLFFEHVLYHLYSCLHFENTAFRAFLDWFVHVLCFIIFPLTLHIGQYKYLYIELLCLQRCTFWHCSPRLSYFPVPYCVSGCASRHRSRFHFALSLYLLIALSVSHGSAFLCSNSSSCLVFPAMPQLLVLSFINTGPIFHLCNFWYLTLANSLTVSSFSIDPIFSHFGHCSIILCPAFSRSINYFIPFFCRRSFYFLFSRLSISINW